MGLAEGRILGLNYASLRLDPSSQPWTSGWWPCGTQEGVVGLLGAALHFSGQEMALL